METMTLAALMVTATSKSSARGKVGERELRRDRACRCHKAPRITDGVLLIEACAHPRAVGDPHLHHANGARLVHIGLTAERLGAWLRQGHHRSAVWCGQALPAAAKRHHKALGETFFSSFLSNSVILTSPTQVSSISRDITPLPDVGEERYVGRKRQTRCSRTIFAPR